MSTDWHVAQLNIATALYPMDDQRMSRFVEQLDAINALAFTFKVKFPPPGQPGEPQDLKPEPFCSGWE